MTETIELLRESGEQVAREVAEATAGQWTGQGPAGRWNIQQNVEHLILVERGVLIRLRRAMGSPAIAREEPLTDEQVWARLTGGKLPPREAPESVKPSGAWTDRTAALAEFARLRAETIRYASTTADPLRERWIRFAVGELDGVQTLLLLAGHALRHVEQIRSLRDAANEAGR